MTRNILGSAIALALGCAVGLSAQTTSSTDAVNVNRDEDRGKDKAVTVVGCVQPQVGANDDEFVLADIQPAGAASSASSMSGDAVGTSGSETSGATGTSGSASESTSSGTSTPSHPTQSSESSAHMGMSEGAKPMHSAYELTGDREDDLQNIVGRRIEVTGTVEDNEAQEMDDSATRGASEMGATGTSGTSDAAGTPSATGAAAESSGTQDAPDEMQAGQTQSRQLARLKITSYREVSGDCPMVQR